MQLYIYTDLSSDSVQLNAEESHHIAKVMRLRKGDTIYITDGKGLLARAILTDPDPRGCEVQIIERTAGYGKRKYNLHLAVSPTKNIDRFEWFLEKATEIGIDTITPVLATRSERKVINKDRLEKVIVAACKQSIKAYVPTLNALVTFNELVTRMSYSGNRYIAHCGALNLPLLKTVYKPGTDAFILIGPEGDFTKDEIENAEINGCTAISLGDMRLRTETAAVVSCHSIALMNQ